jgi:CTP:molybdopterin cytidylyltransferase MocA
MRVVAEGAIGLVLAAGAGSRFGMPKALARTPDGTPWLRRATTALVDGGCEHVVVVLGAMAESAIHLVPREARIVIARDWHDGQSSSLRAGLEACASSQGFAVLVTLVDLPDLDAEAARRVLADAGSESLRRAAYDGKPGHPVLIGREHWGGVATSLSGDTGAARYVAEHGAAWIDCSGLGGLADVDEGAA